MKLILVEGAKNVGKTTNFGVIKLNKNELIELNKEPLNKDIYVDRMFLKQYVYGNMGLNDAILCAHIFDEIHIVLPQDLEVYILQMKLRMQTETEYYEKLLKTHTYFNRLVKNTTFEEFLVVQIRRYYRIMFRLIETNLYVLEVIEPSKTNMAINTFKFKKKHL